MQSLARGVWVIVLSIPLLLAIGANAAKSHRVIIFKNDGKSVSGEVTDLSPGSVTVKPSPAAEPVTIPWKDIKPLSDGTTRQKVLDDYQLHHADELCSVCKGGGQVDCAACGGSGVDPAQATECHKCNGTGVIGKCSQCKGEKTTVCPNNCLKESSFTGKRGPDGRRRVSIKKGSIGAYVSDGHIGQVVSFKNGLPDLVICPKCGGKTVISCPTCHGTGDKVCATCHGGGKIGRACDVCKGTRKTDCKDCNGTGLKTAKS